jgi:hypothetical protein
MSSTCEIIRRPIQELTLAPRQGSLAFTSVQLSGMNHLRGREHWVVWPTF